jgi:aryl-alcohol dehydrogenase/geraniol dehydrogenase (NAD+)
MPETTKPDIREQSREHMSTRSIRAAVLRETGKPWQIEDVEIASPKDDEVMIRMVGTGMCHTDLVCRDGFPVPMPIVLGHEGAGVVEEVGPQVTRVKPGDHVVLSFAACGSCRNCQRHQPAYCYEFLAWNFSGVRPDRGDSPLSMGGKPLSGAFFGQSSFATFAIARESNTVVIGKDLPLERMGPLGCGIQTGAGAAVNSVGVGEGDSLAVFGGGAVGLSALLGAKAVGAGCVIVVEPNAERRELARDLGADHVIDPNGGGDVLTEIKAIGGVHFALDSTGIPAVIGIAVESLLPMGTLGLIGVPPPDAMMPANLLSMLIRGVTIKYITEGDADPQTFIPRMIDWYRAGKFPFDRLIETFPFDKINEAATATESGRVIKPVLVF